MPRRPEVDAWFERYDNPMKPVVQRLREIVLDADPRVDEASNGRRRRSRTRAISPASIPRVDSTPA